MLESKSNRIIIAIFLASCLFLFALILGINQNSAGAALPPRPEPTATPLPGVHTSTDGGYIELLYGGLPVGPNGVWTVVEWQDPYTEKWTAVEGWQGTVELDGTQRWWVAPKDLGEGPFRWLVYDEKGGDLLETSETFDLPAHAKQYVIVILPLPEEAE